MTPAIVVARHENRLFGLSIATREEVWRTPLGDRTVKAVAARIARIERAWEQEVGVRRFRGFRSVVETLAMREPEN